MKKLAMLLIAVMLVSSLMMPALAYSRSPIIIITPDNGDDSDYDDDDDDYYDDDDDDGETTTDKEEDAVIVPVWFTVVEDDQRIEDALKIAEVDDALLIVDAHVHKDYVGKMNSGEFSSDVLDDVLKTEDGQEPSELPFKLIKIVGEEKIDQIYKVDYIVDWATGTITIYNIDQDATYVFVAND